MKLGLGVNVMRDDFRERLAFAKENFDFVELGFDGSRIEEVSNLKIDFPVTVHLPFRGVYLSSVYDKVNNASLAIIEKMILIGKEIGAEIFTVHPMMGAKYTSYKKLNARMDAATKTNISKLINFATDNSVTLAFENLSEQGVFNKPADFQAFKIKDICFDSCHSECNKFSSSEFIKKAIESGLEIKNIHMSGWDKKEQHVALDNATVNLGAFFNALKPVYDGGIVLEIKTNNHEILLRSKSKLEKFI